jgi:cytochrome b
VSEAPHEAAAWDLPTRAFHWLLAFLVVFSFTTGKIGGPWLEWHMKSGYAILALLLFRLGWGVVGPPHGRFAGFLRGPRAALVHLREVRTAPVPVTARHNPAGGWMVVLMLAVLLLQAATGLFTNDESSHEGPLAPLVSNATIDRMSAIHGWNQWAVVAVVGIHVTAIAAYQWILGMNLTRAMVRGPWSASPRAILLLAAAGAAVYALVVLLPRFR